MFTPDELENSIYLTEYNAIITLYSDKIVVYTRTKLVKTEIDYIDSLQGVGILLYFIATSMYKMIELE